MKKIFKKIFKRDKCQPPKEEETKQAEQDNEGDNIYQIDDGKGNPLTEVKYTRKKNKSNN